ncbi:MAG: ABC transporter ATP-binding protein [Chloroflexi bacterium]|nr:ABC transporter ATP-binding protein [Chloroflexota bacterium]
MSTVLEARALRVDYQIERRWLNALNDITLDIQPDEIHGLVGESGSGKSTLGLALMRYLAPNARISSGQILLDGEDLAAKSPEQMRTIWGRKLNLVPQNPLAALNPSYTIGEQISEITRLHEGLSRKAALDAAVEMLRKVKIADPDVVARRYPHQLSGGMRQRVSIAMALSTQPRLLVLDEPTTALDVTTQAVILDLFRELIHENRAAALYVSHDLATVAQLCERVTVMYAGEVMETAPAAKLYARPLHPYTAGLLASLPRSYADQNESRLPVIPGVAASLADRPPACVFADRCPVAQAICREVKPALEETPDGRAVRCHRWQEIARDELELIHPPERELPAQDSARKGAVLEIDRLTKHFQEGGVLARLMGQMPKPVRAVDDVSLYVNARATLGLVGESGSGKTTLARLIVGLEPADSGAIELLGADIPYDVRKRTPDMLSHLRLVMQNPQEALNPYQSIGYGIGRAVRMFDRTMSNGAVKARVEELLASVRLPASHADRYPAELSGGEKQRVAIARAFAAEPALILLDEPTSSLDVSVQAVVLNLLKDLRARTGTSYLLISHDLDVVAYLAEWICVMYLGEIVEQGPSANVYVGPSHPYTEALVSAVPVADPTASRTDIRLEGDVPSARNIPTGCRFHTRCPRYLGDICRTEAPPFRDAGDGHLIRCHIEVDELRRLQVPAGGEGDPL